MNKTPLITAMLASACAATTTSVKKPETPAEIPAAQAQAEQTSLPSVQEQTQAEIAAIYESVRDACRKKRQELADDRMERIQGCLCESEQDSPSSISPRKQCFEDKGVPLHDDDYNPIEDEADFEQQCRIESAAELGADFEQAKTAYKAVQATKLSYKHKAIFVNRASLPKEEAQDYIEFVWAMHRNERFFYDKNVWKILGVDNMDHLYNHYFKDVADIFRSRGYEEEAKDLEGRADVIKLYYGAPEQYLQPSKITEYFTRAGLINEPPPPRCTEEPKD